MDFSFLLMLLAGGAYLLKRQDQLRRIRLLASHLGKYTIEKRLEELTTGYLRALAEPEAQRQAQIWQLLGPAEKSLSEQFSRFAKAFAEVEASQTRVSRLPIALPYADRLLPQATFDLRQALTLHAQGLAQAARESSDQLPRERAFTLMAEIFLLQHTCHWFCRSRSVASARLLSRHKTSHAQALAAVSTSTRQAYLALIGT